MAYQSLDSGHTRHSGASTAEYWVYFALIFLVALPFEFAQWALGLFRRGPNPGVLSRARSRALIITPTIFSA